MKIARYADRLTLQFSESEYLAAHRRFSEGRVERLKMSVAFSAPDGWLNIQVEPIYNAIGNILVRLNNGSWSVSFSNAGTADLSGLPLFPMSDVGRYAPDDSGLEIVKIPDTLMNPGPPAVGKEIILSSIPDAQRLSDAPPAAPTAKKAQTQEEFLEQMRRAAKILNKGVSRGFIPKYDENGLIVKVSIPDVDI